MHISSGADFAALLPAVSDGRTVYGQSVAQELVSSGGFYFKVGEFYSRKSGVNSVLLLSFALIKAVFCNNNTRFETTIENSPEILAEFLVRASDSKSGNS